MLTQAEEVELSELIEELEGRKHRIVFIPPGLDEAKRESLEGATCFRRCACRDEIWEFWGWDNE